MRGTNPAARQGRRLVKVTIVYRGCYAISLTGYTYVTTPASNDTERAATIR